MKKFLFHLVMVLFANCTLIQGQDWIQINPASKHHLSSIYFCDDNIGYVTCSNGIIIKTTNGGNTWAEQNSGALSLSDIFFTNPETGYTVGNYGSILKTIDGGNTWQKQNSNTIHSLSAVFFCNADTGYVAGDSGTIMKTTDGGVNWELQTSGTTNHSFFSLFFYNSRMGFAIGCEMDWVGERIVLKTNDGGETWHEIHIIPPPFSYWYHSVYFPDPDTGYIVGDNYGGGERIYKSVDGGNNWTQVYFTLQGYLHDIYFSDANHGYAIGFSSIVKTNDGGANWTTISMTNGAGQIEHACFLKSNTCFAIQPLDGSIFKITNGGTELTATSLDYNWNLSTVSFPDVNNGYIVGETKFHNYYFLKTNDGGFSKRKLLVDSDILGEIRSIHFTSKNTGFISTDYGEIYKTTNGGTTWTQVYVGNGGFLISICFPDENTGYILSTYGVVLKTDNAGISWSEKYIGSAFYHPLSIFFTEKDIGFVVGNNGVISKTTDGGVSWVNQTSGTTMTLTSVFFNNNSIGYTVGVSGTILKTVDGGANWIQQYSGTLQNLSSVFFINPTIGYVVGDSGTILKTVNGGSTWNFQASPTKQSLHCVYFPTEEIGYAVGDSGTILKNTRGSNGINEEQIQNRILIYPNPGNDKVTLALGIPNQPICEASYLIVYTVTGLQIIKQPLLNNRTEIDVRGLDKGVYFVKVFCNESFFSGKFIRE